MLILYIRIGYDPLQIAINARVDAWMLRFATAQAPGDNTNGDPALIWQLHEQRTTAITLTAI